MQSVGAGGGNKAADVKIVQELLNRAAPAWGGPSPALAVDGVCGMKTTTAIRQFQTKQFGSVFMPDGRVDPGQMTLGRLNLIADSTERPGGILRLSREPIDHVRQPTNMTYWAAAGTMLVGARDQICRPIRAVMQQADAKDPGYGYLNLFDQDSVLPPYDTGRYTRALGLQVGPKASFTVQGWRSMMSTVGAIGVVGLSPFLHIRVITEMIGDGSAFGTFFTVHDPGVQQPYSEVFATFALRYESAAFVDDRMDQLWYK